MSKGKYTIKLPDGREIPLWFSTWSLKKWAQAKNISVDELANKCFTGVIKLDDMSQAILIAAENEAIENKQEFVYTERDADKWIDEIGGLFGAEMKKIVTVMLASIVDVDPTVVTKEIDLQKAKVPQKKSTLAGRSSTRTQPKQGSRRRK